MPLKPFKEIYQNPIKESLVINNALNESEVQGAVGELQGMPQEHVNVAVTKTLNELGQYVDHLKNQAKDSNWHPSDAAQLTVILDAFQNSF